MNYKLLDQEFEDHWNKAPSFYCSCLTSLICPTSLSSNQTRLFTISWTWIMLLFPVFNLSSMSTFWSHICLCVSVSVTSNSLSFSQSKVLPSLYESPQSSVKAKGKWKLLSRVWLFATPWTIQSMEFSRLEYWSGQPFPSPGDLPNPQIEARSPTLQADSLPAEPQGKPIALCTSLKILCIIINATFPKTLPTP